MKSKRNLWILFLALTLSTTWLSTSMAQTALQTQYGPDGVEVDLVRAKIGGKVLSVVFAFRNTGSSSADVTYKIEDVHYIDNTESKKYQVLKDEKGAWLAGPIDYSKKFIKNKWERYPTTHIYLSEGKKKIVWYKFPAPPENVTKIQINLPEISPFDDVEITR
ncbi:MAG: hypothetical protein CSA09_03985 [Candidatus Contendobacter odensis]|uniref:DUF4352 domain-containing protein n=1 Tax=Candidatus Contendibacter odensensis TaxID=1400860 RepID=A0A2G6PFK9_9GAMM|nr:MAG: hypothetical protein CSA09_03985 [Candidatus Contendobacter odensis]